MAKFFGITFFLCLAGPLVGNLLEERLKELTLHEKMCMGIFFEHAVKQDQAAHVLFFENKPAALIGTILKNKNRSFQDVLQLKGWRAFKRHEELFPHPDYLFSEHVVNFNEDFRVLHIYLINRKALLNSLQTFHIVFEEELGGSFDPDLFLSQLEEGTPLPTLLNHSERLLGMVLGYGYEAPQAFEEAPEIETENYTRILHPIPENCQIQPIVFMGNPHSDEVHQLVSTYQQELETIWAVYKHAPNKLLLIMNQLCPELVAD